MNKTLFAMICLAGLPLATPHTAAAAEQQGAKLYAAVARPAEPGKSLPPVQESLAPPPDQAQRPVAVGFADSNRLRQAVRDRIQRDDRYQVIATSRMPRDPAGVYVSGRLVELKKADGWVQCSASYFVATQPTRAAQIVGKASSRVPMLPARSLRDRAEVRELAEDACLSEMAAKIKDKMARIAG